MKSHSPLLALLAIFAFAPPPRGLNTLFLHTSDHGAQWAFGKWNLYDYGTRVPFVAAWPGKIKPGSTSSAMPGPLGIFRKTITQDRRAEMSPSAGLDKIPDRRSACGGRQEEESKRGIGRRAEGHGGFSHGRFRLSLWQR